jgi:hypothetical protein
VNIRNSSGSWRRPAAIAALVALGVLAAVPAGRAAASDCSLGSYKDFVAGCTFDSDGDGVEDWFVADTDGDGILDTISYDSDNNFRLDTFYILEGPNGKIDMRYDHDEDGLFDDEENFYGTDPYNPDTDWDGYSDTVEVQQGSQSMALDPWCNPLGCG